MPHRGCYPCFKIHSIAKRQEIADGTHSFAQVVFSDEDNSSHPWHHLRLVFAWTVLRDESGVRGVSWLKHVYSERYAPWGLFLAKQSLVLPLLKFRTQRMALIMVHIMRITVITALVSNYRYQGYQRLWEHAVHECTWKLETADTYERAAVSKLYMRSTPWRESKRDRRQTGWSWRPFQRQAHVWQTTRRIWGWRLLREVRQSLSKTRHLWY